MDLKNINIYVIFHTITYYAQHIYFMQDIHAFVHSKPIAIRCEKCCHSIEPTNRTAQSKEQATQQKQTTQAPRDHHLPKNLQQKLPSN